VYDLGGLRCWCRWQDGLFYRGVVVTFNPESLVAILDIGIEVTASLNSLDVVSDQIPASADVRVGSRVIAAWPGSNQYHPGKVASIENHEEIEFSKTELRYRIKFSDGVCIFFFFFFFLQNKKKGGRSSNSKIHQFTAFTGNETLCSIQHLRICVTPKLESLRLVAGVRFPDENSFDPSFLGRQKGRAASLAFRHTPIPVSYTGNKYSELEPSSSASRRGSLTTAQASLPALKEMSRSSDAASNSHSSLNGINSAPIMDEEFILSFPLPGPELTKSGESCPGILYHVGSNGDTEPYSNPARARKLVASASSVSGFGVSSPAFFDRLPMASFTEDVPDSWIALDFGPYMSVRPRGYSLCSSWDPSSSDVAGRGSLIFMPSDGANGASGGAEENSSLATTTASSADRAAVTDRRDFGHYTSNWQLQGSHDGLDWVILSSHFNDSSLATPWVVRTFELSSYQKSAPSSSSSAGQNEQSKSLLNRRSSSKAPLLPSTSTAASASSLSNLSRSSTNVGLSGSKQVGEPAPRGASTDQINASDAKANASEGGGEQPAFRVFRLVCHGPSEFGKWNLAVACFELFGELIIKVPGLPKRELTSATIIRNIVKSEEALVKFRASDSGKRKKGGAQDSAKTIHHAGNAGSSAALPPHPAVPGAAGVGKLAKRNSLTNSKSSRVNSVESCVPNSLHGSNDSLKSSRQRSLPAIHAANVK
jgi:hypothetical protein